MRLLPAAVVGGVALTALTVVPAHADDAPGVPGVTQFVRGDGSFTVTPVPAGGGGPVTSYLVEALAVDGQGQPLAGPAAGSCTVPAAGPVAGSGGVQGSCVIDGLVRTTIYVMRTTATGSGGTAVGPTTAQAVPVTNASVAELFRCDGAPGQPRSIPVSIATIQQDPVSRRDDGRTVVRMTPALPAGAGTLVLTPAIRSLGAPQDHIRFSRTATFITDLMDPVGLGFVPNAAGDPATGTTTTVYSEVTAYPSQLFQVPPNPSEQGRLGAAAMFLPAPGSPYCADLKTQAYQVQPQPGPVAAWSWFLDDPRIVPAAPVVQPGPIDAGTGTGSATVTVTAPAAARFVTSYTVTASPGGATCTIPAPTAGQAAAGTEPPVSPLACTLTGLTPLADGRAYTFTAASNGPWGRYAGIDLPGDSVLFGSSPATSVPSPPATPAAPAPVTVSADTLTKTYGEVDPVLTYTVTGLQQGDTLTTTPTCSRGPGENTGTTTITCTGAVADQTHALTRTPKYAAITHAAGTFSITKRPVTVTPTGRSITYGDAPPTSFPYAITSGSLVGGDALTGSCGVAGTPKAVGTYPITCDLSAGPNYEVTVAEAYLTIAKKAGVVTPDPQTITYGDPEPTFTYSVSGLEPGDTLDAEPICGVVGTHTAAGTYTITCSGGADDALDLTRTGTATLTITRAALTLSADDKTRTTSQANPELTYTAAGLVGADTVETAFTGAPALSTTATSRSPAGSYPIAISAGTVSSSNYEVAYVPGTLTVTTAGPTTKPTPTLSPGALVIATRNKGRTIAAITVSSRLTAAGAPVTRRSITFTIPGVPLCTARTDTSGVATCAIRANRAAAILFQGGYTAIFAGDRRFKKARSFSRDVRVVKAARR